MKILAIILALVLILVFAGSAAAHSNKRLVAPPVSETLPIEEITPVPFTGSEMAPVYKVGGKIFSKSCPTPLDGPAMDCPPEKTADLY